MSVYIHPSAQIGEGTTIGKFCVISRGVKIGKNCKIEAHVKISIGCVVGDNVFLGPGVNLLNDKYPPSDHLTPAIIEDDVIVGGGAMVLCVKLGRGCVVGAGSAVTKNVPEQEVWWGNPASFHYRREEYEKKRKREEKRKTKAK